MRPRQFLELAEQLANGSSAAECRSAISRAYYAIFNLGEEFFERMGLPRPKREYHIILQRRLLNSGDKGLEKVGSRLGDLHTKRVSADYKMTDKLIENPQSARDAVERATEMAETLEKCPIYSDRWKNIKEAITKAESF